MKLIPDIEDVADLYEPVEIPNCESCERVDDDKLFEKALQLLNMTREELRKAKCPQPRKCKKRTPV